jgi:nucleoside phosphorylase
VDHVGRRATARVGIVTILQVEFDAARTVFGALDQVPGTGYYTNDPGSHELILTKADGRGNQASALCARDLVEDFRPEVVLVVGIAGGLAQREGVSPGDLVVPDYLHYADFRSLKKEGDQPRHAPYDPPAVTLHSTCVFPVINDPSWRDGISLQPPESRKAPRVLVGALVSGEKVYGDATHEEQRRLLEEKEYSDAVAVDMESMGVARAVHKARQSVSYDPRLLIVRGISDPVNAPDEENVSSGSGPREVMDPADIRELWRAYASHVAAVFALAVVSRILEFDDHRLDVRSARTRAESERGTR